MSNPSIYPDYLASLHDDRRAGRLFRPFFKKNKKIKKSTWLNLGWVVLVRKGTLVHAQVAALRACTVQDPPSVPSHLWTATLWVTVHLSLKTEWSRPEAPAEGSPNNTTGCQ